MDETITMRARRGDICVGPDTIYFHAFSLNPTTGKRGMAKQLVFEEAKRYETAPSLLTLEVAEAQILIDDLWDAGIRPTEAKGSAGAMQAVQNHLADMKKIAFKKLNIETNESL